MSISKNNENAKQIIQICINYDKIKKKQENTNKNIWERLRVLDIKNQDIKYIIILQGQHKDIILTLKLKLFFIKAKEY